MNKREAAEHSRRVDAALARLRAGETRAAEYTRDERALAFRKLSAFHILRLARELGIKAERIDQGGARLTDLVRQRLGL